MKTERYKIKVQNEVPRIGAGMRFVLVKVGYKWVHLKAMHGEGHNKIRRTVWDNMNKEAI